jgi:hypothetical protein
LEVEVIGRGEKVEARKKIFKKDLKSLDKCEKVITFATP